MKEEDRNKLNFEITPKDLAREIYTKQIETKKPLIITLTVFILGGVILAGYFLGPLMAIFVMFLILGFTHVIEKLTFQDYYSKVVYFKNKLDGKNTDNIQKITYKTIKEIMKH